MEELARRFLEEGGIGGGRSPSSFRRWLKRNHGISIGSNRARRVLEAVMGGAQREQVEWFIENEWEAIGKNGEKVLLRQSKIKKRPLVDWKGAIRAFIEEAVSPIDLPSPRPSGGLVAAVSIPDIHVGKLAWGEEVGEDYDTATAVDQYLEALKHLASRIKSSGVDRVLYVVGNDLLHTDGGHLPATTKGTIQDTDTRWQKAFRRAKKMVAVSVLTLAEFAEVDVVIAPGNHDRVLSWTLGEVISAYFAHAEHVHVDNSPKYRKYKRYGKVLFGITHGDQIKPQALPTLMATEVPELWGQTTLREWLLGHIHKKKEFMSIGVDDLNGVRLRYLPSLAAQDRWHYELGYSHQRSAEAHVYDPEKGVMLESYYYAP